MSEKEADYALVKKAQRGNSKAFDILVKKYQHKVVLLVTRYVRDHETAQDVAQDAFIKAYRALGNFRGDSAFYTWLYRIAINTAKNYLVANGRKPLHADLDINDAERVDSAEALRDLDSPEGKLLADEIQQTVNQVLKELPEDLSAAVCLREINGLSYEEIAQTMDCPIGTVRSRIFRAREAIDKRIRPLMES